MSVEEQWRRSPEYQWQVEEQALLGNLMAYANSVPAERIPPFILDPMLGVSPRGSRDTTEE